jgi:hypothetical protein
VTVGRPIAASRSEGRSANNLRACPTYTHLLQPVKEGDLEEPSPTLMWLWSLAWASGDGQGTRVHLGSDVASATFF